MDTAKKVALITGGAQGIGKAIAIQLIREGMQVFILDNDWEAGLETMEEISDLNFNFLHGNVSDESFVKKSVNAKRSSTTSCRQGRPTGGCSLHGKFFAKTGK